MEELLTYTLLTGSVLSTLALTSLIVTLPPLATFPLFPIVTIIPSISARSASVIPEKLDAEIVKVNGVA